MMFRTILFLAISLLTSFHLLAQSQDGLLKNGRSVSYYSQKGQWLRDLEPEESEFIQIGIAKVLNCFKTVKVDGYSRSNRYSPEAEDFFRNRNDDQNGIPFYLQGTLSYAHPDNRKIHIQLDVNPAEIKTTSTLPIKKVIYEKFQDIWKVENYSATTSSGEKYKGTAYFIAVGNTSHTAKTKGLSIKGVFNSKIFAQINHVVIRILAPEKQAMEIIETMDHNRLKEALKYAEKWP